MKLLAFGEVLWDIIDDDAHLGGAPLNYAAHTTQCGGDAAIMSRLGSDRLGEDAKNRISKLNLDTLLLQVDPHKPTGTVPVKLIDGQPDYFITPDVAFDYIDFEDAKSVLSNTPFDVLYFGTLIQRAHSAKALRTILSNYDFKLRFYDVNLRKDCYRKEIISFSLENADVVKLNEDEAAEIGEMLWSEKLTSDDFVLELRKAFPNIKHVIITAGAKGCYIYHDHTLHLVASEPVHVVDAIGAGDSFSAAFMFSFFKTGDILRAAEIGNKVGGYVASSAGAIPAYSQEIKDLLTSL